MENQLKTYNDPAKQLSRLKILDFISHYYRNKDKSQLRVLCFPGAEIDGEEALEVKEIYDKIGITRENITGLEYDKKCFSRLKNANLGIDAIFSDDISYFKETGQVFNIISLDYTSNFQDAQRYAIDLIAAKKLLGDRGILITNYYGSREDNNNQLAMKVNQAIRLMGMSPIDFMGKINPEKMDKILKDAADKLKIKDARSQGIQEGVGYSLLWGKGSIDPFVLAFNIEDRRRLEKVIQDTDQINIDYNINGRNCDERMARIHAFRAARIKQFYDAISEGSTINPLIASLIMLEKIEPYFVEEHESYSYISNKSSPMFLDLWFVDRCKQRFRKDMFVHTGEGYFKFLPGITGKKRDKLVIHARKFAEEIRDKYVRNVIKYREHLDSSNS